MHKTGDNYAVQVEGAAAVAATRLAKIIIVLTTSPPGWVLAPKRQSTMSFMAM